MLYEKYCKLQFSSTVNCNFLMSIWWKNYILKCCGESSSRLTLGKEIVISILVLREYIHVLELHAHWCSFASAPNWSFYIVSVDFVFLVGLSKSIFCQLLTHACFFFLIFYSSGIIIIHAFSEACHNIVILRFGILLYCFGVGFSQIVQAAQNSVGWFRDESDSGVHDDGIAAARRILLRKVL